MLDACQPGAVNGHGHRKTTEDQHGCIDGAEFDVEVIAGNCECFRYGAIERVGEKHSAKNMISVTRNTPHAQSSGLALLLQILEVMLQRRVACFVFYVTLSQCFSPS